MTTTTDTGTDAPARVLSARTRARPTPRTGRCSPTGAPPPTPPALPADPRTVVDFLTGVPGRAGHPAAPGRRHRPPPHRRRTTSGRGSRWRCGPRSAGPPANPSSPRTEIGMRWRRRCAGCPRTAGPQGMFGRRDRCLLVLSQLAGVPYRHLAALTAGDISISGRRRDDPVGGGGVDASSGRRRRSCAGRARSSGG